MPSPTSERLSRRLARLCGRLRFGGGALAGLYGLHGVNRWCIIGAPDRFYLCIVEHCSAEPFKPEGIHINHVGFVVDDIDETVVASTILASASNLATPPWIGRAAGPPT